MSIKYNMVDISLKTKIEEKDILNVYLVGSRIYETHNKSSDYDFIITTNKNINNEEIRNGELNIHIYTQRHFEEKVRECKVQFLEALFTPLKLKESINVNFELKREVLIKEFQKNSDDTYMKYKKIFTYDKQESIKKLFHSIRLLSFGKQILDNNKIIDYKENNELLNEIRNDMYMNIDINEKYNKIREELKSSLS